MFLFLLSIVVELAVLTIGALSRSALAWLFDRCFIPTVKSCGSLVGEQERRATVGWFALRSCYAKKAHWDHTAHLFDLGVSEGWLLGTITLAWSWVYLYLANAQFDEARKVVQWLCERVPLEVSRLNAGSSSHPDVIESLQRPFYASAVLKWSEEHGDRGIGDYITTQSLPRSPLYPKYIHIDWAFASNIGMTDLEIDDAWSEARKMLTICLQRYESEGGSQFGRSERQRILSKIGNDLERCGSASDGSEALNATPPIVVFLPPWLKHLLLVIVVGIVGALILTIVHFMR